MMITDRHGTKDKVYAMVTNNLYCSGINAENGGN